MCIAIVCITITSVLQLQTRLSAAQELPVFSIQTQSITGGQENGCPPMEERAIVRQNISDNILTILSENRGLYIVEPCGEGLWFQVVSINMSRPDDECPSAWVEENEDSVRACGRGSTTGGNCVSASFDTEGREYSRVCGRAIGYQFGSTDAFAQSISNPPGNLEATYVDGLSITHGSSPRQHIWTYASGVTESDVSRLNFNCPCAFSQASQPPSFVGSNWYCESGNPTNQPSNGVILPDDPLWDGQECEGTCCTGISPPWFSYELPSMTTDMLEGRICASENSNQEDVFIQELELYIQ